MNVSQLIEILKTLDGEAVVVLADYDDTQEKSSVARLRTEDIKPLELYQVEHKGLGWYEIADGNGPPKVGERTVVFSRKINGVVLG